jgi:signal transduction histidine kinase
MGVAMIGAIHSIVSISMRYLRSLSIRRARGETLAEHSRFLTRLDHELKNPLTALRAGLKTLALTELDGRQQQIVRAMETETLRLNRLVTDLRKLVELETQPLNLRTMNIEAFVSNVIQGERDRFEAGQRELVNRIEAARAEWVADEDLLALAVDNAFKYTQPADTISLEVSAEQELTITVTDNGSGVPHDALPHVWDELYRAEQAEKIAGSGIGLTLVKAIAERHDGVVGLESEEGRGTVVFIRLPAISPP